MNDEKTETIKETRSYYYRKFGCAGKNNCPKLMMKLAYLVSDESEDASATIAYCGFTGIRL